jgi:hypothetical protein
MERQIRSELSSASIAVEGAGRALHRLSNGHSVRSKFSGWLGQVVVIELLNGHRLAGLMPEEESLNAMGEAHVDLAQCIRVIDARWDGPIEGEYWWYGRRTLGECAVGGIAAAVDVWGAGYALPKNREEVVALLENRAARE